MAKLQQIALRFGVAFQQMQQRITERRAQGFHHIIAATLTADQQPLGGQFLNSFAQRRSRDTKLLGQRAFRRQAFTGFQRALKDHALELLDNIVRQTALPNLIKRHNSISPPSRRCAGALFWPIHEAQAPATRPLPEPGRSFANPCLRQKF
ncbi:hypothetical protein D3C76_1441920 [compost metagenome]